MSFTKGKGGARGVGRIKIEKANPPEIRRKEKLVENEDHHWLPPVIGARRYNVGGKERLASAEGENEEWRILLCIQGSGKKMESRIRL